MRHEVVSGPSPALTASYKASVSSVTRPPPTRPERRPPQTPNGSAGPASASLPAA